jgi:hypothetical protein
MGIRDRRHHPGRRAHPASERTAELLTAPSAKLDVHYKLKSEAWSKALHSFSQVEGVRLHWVELGRANGIVPLVLLHGLNDSYLTWKHVAPALAHNRRSLMPDLPGHGMSERPDASY